MMASTPRKVVPYDAGDFASAARSSKPPRADGLDVLCNVSGMLKWGPSLEFAVEDFERILRINTTSVFVMCQAALPHLIKSGGNIVNTASTAALQGIPYTIAYAASKHAVAAITKSLAIEFASKNVRINAICPGHVDTPMGNSAATRRRCRLVAGHAQRPQTPQRLLRAFGYRRGLCLSGVGRRAQDHGDLADDRWGAVGGVGPRRLGLGPRPHF